MIGAVARRLFGTPSERAVRTMKREVAAVGALEVQVASLRDGEFPARTADLRARVAAGEALDRVLPEAFALAREAARRVLGQRPYDVQLMGGITLHRGRVAEMRTGEGKTLVAVLPAYLNALAGKGVHVVTVNDYLARRDSEEMGKVFAFLGLTVGCVVPGMGDGERQAAYAADVTYATNSEIGFDYLRDNMKGSRAEMVQRGFNFAIIDEVDSILIDEARTPLVISGQGPDVSAAVAIADHVVARLPAGSWEVDAKSRSASLTEGGLAEAERLLAAMGALAEGGHLHDERHLALVPFIHQALRARVLFERDKDYIVHEGKVVIVDENTGRSMDGRRYSDGLHSALEAKEGVAIQPESQTLASVTYQNFFRLYQKLSGMTGTASTEAAELAEIYGLDVVQVPTNRPVARVDHDDEIYRTAAERDAAAVALVAEAHGRGQPVLLGTSSIERSEALSRHLHAAGIPHAVLNARFHEQEARIVAQAGRPGAVTISTNMAGRGTDIKLGGNAEFLVGEVLPAGADEATRRMVLGQLAPQVEEDARRVRDAGGLLVIGTERHESRRVDDQLRGRSGRQGDPGASRFLVSLEDDLMRRFGGERLGEMLGKLGLREGEPITHPWITRSVRKAQERIEAQNFDIRKNLLKYDGVPNAQRKAFYAQRLALIDGEDVTAMMLGMRCQAVEDLVAQAMPEQSYPEQWDVAGLAADIHRLFGIEPDIAAWASEEGVGPAEVAERLRQAVEAARDAIFGGVDPASVAQIERHILLQCLDQAWKEHLAALDQVRDGIGLRAYAQRDPLHEWHAETAQMFERMFDKAAEHALSVLARVSVQSTPEAPAPGDEPPAEGSPG